jgi:hypothetical protein
MTCASETYVPRGRHLLQVPIGAKLPQTFQSPHSVFAAYKTIVSLSHQKAIRVLLHSRDQHCLLSINQVLQTFQILVPDRQRRQSRVVGNLRCRIPEHF